MKILIVNDTRVENHHGCSRVMNCIDINLKLRHLYKIDYISLSHNWPNYEYSKKKLLKADLIVINGEGTLHDNADHVDMLLDIIVFAKAYTIPSIVINATIFNLSINNLEKLSHSKLIYVRDQLSKVYLEENNIKSNYCPDLTFWKTKEVFKDVARKEIGITEGFNFNPNIKVIKYNNFQLFSVFNFKQAFASYSFLRRLIQKNLIYKLFFEKNKNTISIDNHIKFFQFLNKFKFIVTGRYHVVCFCLYLNIPFKYVESNTPKISSLIEDVGLDKFKFKLNDDYQIIKYTSQEIMLINNFTKQANTRINDMFEHILNVKTYE